MDYEQKYECYRKFFEEHLANIYNNGLNEPQKDLYSAMNYSLLAGGKRIRPILIFSFCEACGGNWQGAVELAAALEMIHTYSLIHDDLPSMDDDDYRRGRLTNHKVYGEALATLAGDGLLTDAFCVAMKSTLADPLQYKKVTEILSSCAGSFGMVGGQVLDIQSEQRICTEKEVLDIQTRKTGALIKAACLLGVIAANGSEEQYHAAEVYAEEIGLAFQIRDDMLDVIGDAKLMGKATGMDKDKNTFVRLYGVDACDALVKSHTDQAIRVLEVFQDLTFLKEFALRMSTRSH